MVITGVGVDVASTTRVPRVTNMSRGKSLSEVECGKILAFHEKGHLKRESSWQSQLAQQSYKLIYSQPRWTHNDAK